MCHREESQNRRWFVKHHSMALGVSILDICMREQLAAGELVRVLQPWCPSFPGFYLYAPTRAQMPAKVRALIRFLLEKRSLLG